MVAGGGASREEEFAKGEFCGVEEHVWLDVCPDGIEGFEPVEEFCIEGCWKCSCEGLVEVVMGIDESRE